MNRAVEDLAPSMRAEASLANLTISGVEHARRESSVRVLIICGMLMVGCIVLGTAVTAVNFRSRALARTDGELRDTTLLLARHFDQQLDDFSALQGTLSSQSAFPDIGNTADLNRRLSTLDLHRLLQATVGRNDHVGSLSVFDSTGTLVNSSIEFPVPDISIKSRSYFRDLRDDPWRHSSMGEPIPARIDGDWVTPLAQKIAGRDGTFLGVLRSGLKPGYFEFFLESLALSDGAVITVLHRNGTIIARYPHDEAAIGEVFSDRPLLRKALLDGTVGSGQTVDANNGQELIGAARALRDFPIVIVATRPVIAALAEWRKQTQLLAAAAATSSLLIAAIFLLIVRVISKRYAALSSRLAEKKRKLAVDKDRLDTAINNLNQGLMLFDGNNDLVLFNSRAIEMYGLSTDVIRPGISLHQVVAHRKQTGSFHGDVDEFCAKLISELGQSSPHIVRTLDGRSMLIVNKPITAGGWVALHDDITERTRSERKISHLAHYDALTDLPNRMLFHARLEEALLAVGNGTVCALLYIDIDEFKHINDSLGHPVGDQFLKIVAGRLRGVAGSRDFVARLGGDEFAVVRTGPAGTESLVCLVQQVLEAIRAPYTCLGHRLSSNASIGIAIAQEHGANLDDLLKKADLAMYAAKADGRGTYRFFEAVMEARLMARRALESDLEQAVVTRRFSESGFEVQYQPIIRFIDRSIVGCEALLRWHHPVRGMIPPADFIPVAEEMRFIDELGDWVLAEACAEAANWPDHVRIAVNVSPIQFKNPGFALKVASTLARANLGIGRLELEITEAVLIEDDDKTRATLHQLRGIGVRIALDDFGTGYSSLSYLRRFPFDKIKIDRSFIKDIDTSGARAIVQAVVTIASAIAMTTTAEGVETEQQFATLQALNCDHMQGHLVSTALPAIELRRLFFARETEAFVA
ncbi:EAL domain-containing protein [Tardiphaga sp.]|uniref:bifunctional diguanylate cyclase/phosphodiesterase n=1 Tax=Tardiphaga sp. TaxID=1926292 RepID=UPI0025E671C2|nr:EAL domain-containing protein [Tardiphaga sp.]